MYTGSEGMGPGRLESGFREHRVPSLSKPAPHCTVVRTESGARLLRVSTSYSLACTVCCVNFTFLCPPKFRHIRCMQTHANTKPYCKVGKQLPDTASQGRLHLHMTWPTSAQANLWSSYISEWLSTSQLQASSFMRPKKAIFPPLGTVEEFLLVKPIVIQCQLISSPALKAERGRQALLSSQDFVSLRRSCDFFVKAIAKWFQ